MYHACVLLILYMRASCPCIRSERHLPRVAGRAVTTQRCSQETLFGHPVTIDSALSPNLQMAHIQVKYNVQADLIVTMSKVRENGRSPSVSPHTMVEAMPEDGV